MTALKILIVGAAGATGRVLVDEALRRGHVVTAYVRDPAKLAVAHERLRVVRGDGRDADTLAGALLGHDAAIHVVGSGDTKASTVRTDTAKALVEAARRAGVRRVLAISGLGAGDSRAAQGLFVRWLLVPVILKHLIADQNGLEQALLASDLDWTIVRPGELKDGPARGARPRLDQRGSLSVPRADVAAFLLDAAEQRQFVRQAAALA